MTDAKKVKDPKRVAIGKRSRNKGGVGERELAALLRDNGFDAHRGQQFKGGSDSPDVVGLPGFHVECKRVEKGSLYEWLAQAQCDAAGKSIPVVAHRKNHREWVAVLSWKDFMELVKERKAA